MTELLRAFLDWLLGAHCPLGCGERVFPRDLNQHMTQHGWEPTTTHHSSEGDPS